ncbi:MAG: hypothetical protein DRO18_01080 [Thermoprotei archaeon]|nr:MAG: hypothetical protein DRO18_01080 [Thermoprotei archaeon]
MLRPLAFNVAREFLGLAKEVKECICREKRVQTCSITINQGLFRTCISRAYYSVFIMARYITNLEYYGRPDVHEKVIKRLKDMGLEDVADKLFKLRKERNKADYDVYFNVTSDSMKYVVDIAENVMEALEKMLPSYPPS